MTQDNEHIQLSGGLARVHDGLREELGDRLGFEPNHPRVYDHLIEHYDGPLDLPKPNKTE